MPHGFGLAGQQCRLAIGSNSVLITHFCLPAADPKLAEFLQLMQPRSKQAVWSNEDALLATAAGQKQRGQAAAAAEGVHLEEAASEDEDEYEDLPASGGAAGVD